MNGSRQSATSFSIAWRECRPSLTTPANARRGSARSFANFATAGAVEQFLPVIDNFQLALKAGGSAEQLRAGVELIVKQMDDVLRSLNVQPVETVGAQFDPACA